VTAGPPGVDALIRAGLCNIYCLPGIQNDALFNSFFDRRDEICVIHTRHEQGAAYMALGAALATGKPSVYSVVPGPGFLNTTAALATAYGAGAPVLCLTGQIPSGAIGKGFGFLHELPDQLGIIERLTKFAAHIETPEALPKMMAATVAALCSGRPRPVGVEIPMDILAAKTAVNEIVAPLPEAPHLVDEEAILLASSMLRKAERPLIFVGGGAQGASSELRTLAENLGAPVISYRMGKGSIDGRHPLSQNLPAGHRLWKDCDVVLAVGTRLQIPLTQWGVDDKLRIIKVDVDDAEMKKGRPLDLAIVGDAAATLRRLNDYIRRPVPERDARIQASARLKSEVAASVAILEPQLSYLRAIRDVLPDDGVLVDESTQVGYVSRIAYDAHMPRTYLSSGYQGTLGWGFPTALGAKHALADTPVISITGDGGFMFGMPELSTAVRHSISLVTVVFNDNSFGNVKRMQAELYGGRIIASDLSNPNFVGLANSFGVEASVAKDPGELRSALDAAFLRGGPHLIEVPSAQMPEPRPYLNLPRFRGR
jgi:acetolactate synthase-1/2/3 large subunit